MRLACVGLAFSACASVTVVSDQRSGREGFVEVPCGQSALLKVQGPVTCSGNLELSQQGKTIPCDAKLCGEYPRTCSAGTLLAVKPTGAGGVIRSEASAVWVRSACFDYGYLWTSDTQRVATLGQSVSGCRFSHQAGPSGVVGKALMPNERALAASSLTLQPGESARVCLKTSCAAAELIEVSCPASKQCVDSGFLWALDTKQLASPGQSLSGCKVSHASCMPSGALSGYAYTSDGKKDLRAGTELDLAKGADALVCLSAACAKSELIRVNCPTKP